MNVGIVGAGLIGKKRAQALKEFDDKLIAVADVDQGNRDAFVKVYPCEEFNSWEKMFGSVSLDAVIVATPNKFLAPAVTGAAKKRMHILCEKPLGRNPKESLKMVRAAQKAGVVLKTGFNHRHHPAIRKARELVHGGGIGAVFFLRARYGHGGRPGYDREWRGDPDLAGGGELLDQGVHIVDLFRWFVGDFRTAFGYVNTYFWDISPLEDNGFALFRTESGIIAGMHTSWTNWKNIFSFEVFGRDGFVAVEGLGGSYGKEVLTLGKRKPESGPPETETFVFDGPDHSWIDEWREFRSAVKEHRAPLADGMDGYRAVEMVHAVYQASMTGKQVKLNRTVN